MEGVRFVAREGKKYLDRYADDRLRAGRRRGGAGEGAYAAAPRRRGRRVRPVASRAVASN